MWKFQDFSVIQILREIDFKESRSSKTAVFAISVDFVNVTKNAESQDLEPLNVLKCQILQF